MMTISALTSICAQTRRSDNTAKHTIIQLNEEDRIRREIIGPPDDHRLRDDAADGDGDDDSRSPEIFSTTTPLERGM